MHGSMLHNITTSSEMGGLGCFVLLLLLTKPSSPYRKAMCVRMGGALDPVGKYRRTRKLQTTGCRSISKNVQFGSACIAHVIVGSENGLRVSAAIANSPCTNHAQSFFLVGMPCFEPLQGPICEATNVEQSPEMRNSRTSDFDTCCSKRLPSTLFVLGLVNFNNHKDRQHARSDCQRRCSLMGSSNVTVTKIGNMLKAIVKGVVGVCFVTFKSQKLATCRKRLSWALFVFGATVTAICRFSYCTSWNV
jgi:hypothetical protein